MAGERQNRTRVISKKAIRLFVAAHPEDAALEPALNDWHKQVIRNEFRSFADVRRFWPNADQVGTLIVFNIRGNRYRLAARFNYRGRVYIRAIMTHREYDRGGWQE